MGSASTPGTPWKRRSLARALWRSLESLPSADQMDRMIAREVARSERTGQHFALAVFRVRRGGRLRLAERRLAVTLMRRIRLTDEVGWFDADHLCALLPDTDAAGAQIFTDSVRVLLSKHGPAPASRVYTYPGDWHGSPLFLDKEAQDDRKSAGKSQDDRRDPPNGNGHNGNGKSADRRGTVAVRLNGNGHHNGHNGNGRANGHANGNGHSNGNGHAHALFLTPDDSGGGVAVLEAPPAVQLAPAMKANAIAALLEPAAAPAPAPREDLPVESLHSLLARPMPRWKRALDIAGAATGLLLLLPIFAIVAVAIKLTSKGPVIFTQRRAGLGGRAFRIFKFRTMVQDAEAQKAALRKLSEQDGPAFKLKNDPRITKVGHILRKTSIDELPQLWNVLIGDMSLVGPRPLPVDESEGCALWQKRRLDVTPGLTCIWQIKGRSEVTFAEWVRMDVEYMRRRTIFHDLSIIFRTVPAVLFRRGAR